MEMGDIVLFLQHLPPDMDEVALFAAIEDISISPESCGRATRRIDDPGHSPPPPGLECSPSWFAAALGLNPRRKEYAPVGYISCRGCRGWVWLARGADQGPIIDRRDE